MQTRHGGYMKFLIRHAFSFTCFLLSLCLIGCASITTGITQVITFTIEPKEARCNVVNKDNETLGTVTGKSNLLQVSKGARDLIVKCSADGYRSKTTTIISSTQTAGVIGIAIDFGITDMLTGAMWKYPGHISVILDKSSTGK